MAHCLLHIQNNQTASEGLENVNGEISDCEKNSIPHSDCPIKKTFRLRRKGEVSFSLLLCGSDFLDGLLLVIRGECLVILKGHFQSTIYRLAFEPFLLCACSHLSVEGSGQCNGFKLCTVLR